MRWNIVCRIGDMDTFVPETDVRPPLVDELGAVDDDERAPGWRTATAHGQRRQDVID